MSKRQAKTKYLPVPKINIIPDGQLAKGKVKLRPVKYDKKDDIALLIQDKIKKYLDSDSIFIQKKASQLSKKETDNTKLSLQGLFLKANTIKNESGEMMKELKGLSSSDLMFKSLNMQKVVLDKLVNSYLEKINGLRLREGNYTKADENERSLLPNKLTAIELEYTKLKDIIEGYKKEQSLDPEELNKRDAGRLYTKLLDINRILDPVTNKKKLDETIIQAGQEIERMEREINDNKGVKNNVIEIFQNMLNEFEKKFREIKSSINSIEHELLEQEKRRTGSKENIIGIMKITEHEIELHKIEDKLEQMYAEQKKILQKIINKNVKSKHIVKFNINMSNINRLNEELKDYENTLTQSMKSKIGKIGNIEPLKNIQNIYSKIRQMLKLLWEDFREDKSKRPRSRLTHLSNRDEKNKNTILVDVITDMSLNPLFLLKDGNDDLIDVEKIRAKKGDPFEDILKKKQKRYLSYILPRTDMETIKAFIIVFKRYDIAYRELNEISQTITNNRFPLKSYINKMNSFLKKKNNNLTNEDLIKKNLENIIALEDIYNNVFRKIAKEEKMTRDIYEKDYEQIIYKYSNYIPVDFRRIRGGGISPNTVTEIKENPGNEISNFRNVIYIDEVPKSDELDIELKDDEKKIYELQENFDDKLLEFEKKISDRDFGSLEGIRDDMEKMKNEISGLKYKANEKEITEYVKKYENLVKKYSEEIVMQSHGFHRKDPQILKKIKEDGDIVLDKIEKIMGTNVNPADSFEEIDKKFQKIREDLPKPLNINISDDRGLTETRQYEAIERGETILPPRRAGQEVKKSWASIASPQTPEQEKQQHRQQRQQPVPLRNTPKKQPTRKNPPREVKKKG